ncbi:MAG TPA: ATP-binding protein [Herpetosiphonaceae bacterium]|nr:ATP-binding protein [Herpetosiphonaceae bacterium]
MASAHGADPADRALLETLRHLLTIEATDLRSALDQVGTLLSTVLQADKVDVLLYDAKIDSLVALGRSKTPLAVKQHRLGLDRIAVSNGGRVVEVYQSGEPYLTVHADQDPGMPRGDVDALGVRSLLAVPLDVNGERRGVLSVASVRPERYGPTDLIFLNSVASWVGMVAHRAELVAQIRAAAQQQAKQVTAEELITTLAHDLGNYLAPLVGRLSLIQHRARRDDRSRDIRDADAAMLVAERLRRLIGDLLDVGRLRNGLLALTRQPVNLVALVQETVAMLETRDTKIDQIVPADEVCVEADVSRLRQAVENLISNAIKHSPLGTSIQVGVSTELRNGCQWALLTVRDYGVGIPPEMLETIFERFTSGPQSGGLGLGLYLANQIVLAHDGLLTVESQVNQGSCFTIALLTIDNDHH